MQIGKTVYIPTVADNAPDHVEVDTEYVIIEALVEGTSSSGDCLTHGQFRKKNSFDGFFLSFEDAQKAIEDKHGIDAEITLLEMEHLQKPKSDQKGGIAHHQV